MIKKQKQVIIRPSMKSISERLLKLNSGGEFTRIIKLGIEQNKTGEVIQMVKDQIRDWPADLEKFLGTELLHDIKAF